MQLTGELDRFDVVLWSCRNSSYREQRQVTAVYQSRKGKKKTAMWRLRKWRIGNSKDAILDGWLHDCTDEMLFAESCRLDIAAGVMPTLINNGRAGTDLKT